MTLWQSRVILHVHPPPTWHYLLGPHKHAFSYRYSGHEVAQGSCGALEWKAVTRGKGCGPSKVRYSWKLPLQAPFHPRAALPRHCSDGPEPPEGSNTNQIFPLDPNVDAHSLIICKAHYYKLFLSPPPINEPGVMQIFLNTVQERAICTHTQGV